MIDPRLKAASVTLIWEHNFNKLVGEIYGEDRLYHFQQQGDMKGQDSIHIFTVPADRDYEVEPEPDDDWQGYFPRLSDWLAAEPPNEKSSRSDQLYWEREFYPPFEEVVNDLHQRGLIDAGSYALHIHW